MEEIFEKLEQIKDTKFVSSEDYIKVFTVLTEIQHEIVKIYNSQPPENKHAFIQANLNLFLHVIENSKLEIKKQCYLRHQKDFFIENGFSFIAYYRATKEKFGGLLSVVNYFNLNNRHKRIIKQQDDVIEIVKNIFAGFMVDFYREPITFEMAAAASSRILCMSDFLVNTEGDGNPELLMWIKECEPYYAKFYQQQ
jgi:hypothetical protein